MAAGRARTICAVVCASLVAGCSEEQRHVQVPAESSVADVIATIESDPPIRSCTLSRRAGRALLQQLRSATAVQTDYQWAVFGRLSIVDKRGERLRISLMQTGDDEFAYRVGDKYFRGGSVAAVEGVIRGDCADARDESGRSTVEAE